jgi:hypothetical protein
MHALGVQRAGSCPVLGRQALFRLSVTALHIAVDLDRR